MTRISTSSLFKHLALIVALVCIVVLPACKDDDDFSGGRPITKEDLIAMSAAIFANDVDPTEDDPSLETYEEDTVHWTPGGSVFHRSINCQHLKRSKEIYHGTVFEASIAGKEYPCSDCSAIETAAD